MAVAQEPQSATRLGLTIESMTHFAIPIRDHEKARKFYGEVLGGIVRREPDWDRVREGRGQGAFLGVEMCDGVMFDLWQQPYGMGEPDREHPHHAFSVQTPEQLDAFRAKLEAWGTPTVLATRADPPPRPGEACSVELHFKDPDGNSYRIECAAYPFRPDIQVGVFDPWALYYPWPAWPKDQAAASATTTDGLRLDRLGHFALTVLDLDRAEFFYTQVLGATFMDRTSGEQVASGLARRPHVHVRWGPIDVLLVQQRSGQGELHQSHPHHAFLIETPQVDAWIDHLASWDVPSILLCTEVEGAKQVGEPVRIDLYFRDPDGNPLELDNFEYPLSDRCTFLPRVSSVLNPRFDHWAVMYHGAQWWEKHRHRFVPH